ncbi:hypothetical protein EIP86_006208 [Pleurotus ostreatoroseus]|nr:hypothetical protein EIP86_006208 [Pleurotus ostreatoroseus]
MTGLPREGLTRERHVNTATGGFYVGAVDCEMLMGNHTGCWHCIRSLLVREKEKNVDTEPITHAASATPTPRLRLEHRGYRQRIRALQMVGDSRRGMKAEEEDVDMGAGRAQRGSLADVARRASRHLEGHSPLSMFALVCGRL